MALSRSLIVAAVTLLVALGLGSSAAFAPSADAFASSAALTVVEGDVQISHRGQDFLAAREGDVLAVGDTIRTGDRASAEVTYFEGSSVRLDSRAELVVDRLAFESDGATAITQTIERTCTS